MFSKLAKIVISNPRMQIALLNKEYLYPFTIQQNNRPIETLWIHTKTLNLPLKFRLYPLKTQ
jgi:hypothetical protein